MDQSWLQAPEFTAGIITALKLREQVTILSKYIRSRTDIKVDDKRLLLQ